MEQEQNTEHAPRVLINRLDKDHFNYLTVMAQVDTMTVPGIVTATVLFGGYPVAAVTTDGADGEDYRMYPLLDDIEPRKGGHNQSYLAFLLETGSLSDEEAVSKYLDGKYTRLEDVFDEYGDDGHAWIGFLGEVAHAIHAAYPDITPFPEGF